MSDHRRKGNRLINDRVEEIVARLCVADDEFRKLISAICNSQPVEGSLIADETMAAQMIRNKAMEEGLDELARLKVRAIILAMRVALRRFGIDQKSVKARTSEPKRTDDDENQMKIMSMTEDKP